MVFTICEYLAATASAHKFSESECHVPIFYNIYPITAQDKKFLSTIQKFLSLKLSDFMHVAIVDVNKYCFRKFFHKIKSG